MLRRFMVNRLFFWIVVLAPLSVWSVTATQEGGRMGKLAASVQEAVAILKDPELSVPARREERREMLRRVIYQEFDFARMSQSAVGRAWVKFTPGQQQRFSELFRRLLENTYMGVIERYNGERVEFVKETNKAEDLVLVESVVYAKGQQYRLGYYMRNTNGAWKVDDVVIEGVSVVANYRSQFQQAIRTAEDIEPLLTRLQEKVDAAATQKGS
ncbi:MAG: ABC transporter substrate-binding protein [Magnetococcales bacterium]|nr:ABC transporter substrate-binding protein [Magnetococcales bacterium]